MNIRTRACLSSSGSTRDTRRCTRDLDRRGLPPPILPPVLEPNQHTLKRPALSDESSVHSDSYKDSDSHANFRGQRRLGLPAGMSVRLVEVLEPPELHLRHLVS